MHREALTGLLADLFSAHGFDVTQDAALEGRTGTVYGAPVLVETTDRVLLVERRGPEKTIEVDLVEELRRVVEDTGADGALLVHLGRRTPAAEDAATRAGILLWDETILTQVVGEMYVHASSGRTPPALPLHVSPPKPRVASSLEDLLPPAFTPETPQTEAPEGVLEGLEAFDMGALDILDVEPAPGPTPAAPGSPTTFPCLPPRIGPEDAARAVQDRLFTVADQARLVLQPVHLLDYACDLLLEGSLQYDTVEGRIEVHGTTKLVREVDADIMDPRHAGAVPATAHAPDEKTLRVSDERAMERAHHAILEAHTRVVEIETHDDDEDFSIIEQKRVAPRPDQVRLRSLGVVLRPLWRLQGPNGNVLVDALTGAVEEETLRSPNPDTIILD